MLKIYSKCNNKLLHLVYQADEFCEGMTELVSPDNFIQCMFLKASKGKSWKPHQHKWRETPNKQTIAQESWVVVRGAAKAFFYDVDGTLLTSIIVKAGDITFTLEGGHHFEILEDNTMVYEFKTGPYEGVEKDKVFL